MHRKTNLGLFFSLFIGLLLFSYMIYDLSTPENYERIYFGVPVKVVDSIFNSLSDVQRVNILILADTILFEGDTNNYFANISLNSNRFVFSDELLPDTISQKFPPFNALFTIDDSLYRCFIDYCVNKNLQLKEKFIFSNFFKHITDDTLLQRFYLQRFILAYKALFSKGELLIPVLKSFKCSDSSLYRFYKRLTDSVFAIYTPSYEYGYLFKDSLYFDKIIITSSDSSFSASKFLISPINLIVSDNPAMIRNSILNAISLNPSLLKYFRKKVKRAIALKYKLQNFDSLANFSCNSQKLRLSMFYNSVLLLNNDTNLIPLQDIKRSTIAYFYSDIPLIELRKELLFYKNMVFRNIKAKKILLSANYNVIFVINKKLSDSDSVLIRTLFRLEKRNNLIIINFGNIDNLKYLREFKTVVLLWSNSPLYQKAAADAIFGGISVKGRYPLDKFFPFLSGEQTPKTRIRRGLPIEANVDYNKLVKIDSIVRDAIKRRVFPGCQVFIVKDGIAIWDKAYGYFTYDRRHKVRNTDLYDLASMTKIVATTLLAMRLMDMKKLELDKQLKNYFKDTKINYKNIKEDTIIQIDTFNLNKISEKELNIAIKDKDTIHLDDTLIVSFDTIIFRKTPKLNIFTTTPRELLMHKSGIQPAMPILKFIKVKDYYNQLLEWKVIDSQKVKFSQFYHSIYSDRYISDSANIEVAKNMYLTKPYFDTLRDDTKALLVSSKKRYIYSDVNMILLKWTIDSILGYNSALYLDRYFYKRLGLRTTCYKPLKHFSKNRIAPTERDKYWRKQLLQGYVHDPSAALLGGIAGNAGIFSDAKDIAIIGQMLLNGGIYGGIRFIKKSTVQLFTKRQPDSFRGLGFDMWRSNYIIAKSASHRTYGHLGFTGTCLWIDPDNKIVFVFLSNRVYPSSKNFKINRYKIRQKVHQAIYDAIIQ